MLHTKIRSLSLQIYTLFLFAWLKLIPFSRTLRWFSYKTTISHLKIGFTETWYDWRFRFSPSNSSNAKMRHTSLKTRMEVETGPVDFYLYLFFVKNQTFKTRGFGNEWIPNTLFLLLLYFPCSRMTNTWFETLNLSQI